MRATRVRTLAALSLLPAAIALTPGVTSIDVQPGSRLWINGSSTVRSFECAATSFDTNIQAAPGSIAALASGEKVVTAVQVTVPATRLDCKNGTMNEHMLKALKANAHPDIVFSLASYDLARENDALRITLAGKLTLGGIERPVTIVTTAKEEGEGALRVTGAHEVRMTEFGLKPPSLMLGTMKVDEKVKVSFDLLLKD
jgi:polyisoprenoid-binding protein YceI